jgi:hypothetical protein
MKQQINGSMSFWNMGFAAAAVIANESDKTTITNPDNNPDNNNSDSQKKVMARFQCCCPGRRNFESVRGVVFVETQ